MADIVERLRFEASERAKDPEWFDEDFSQAIVSAADEIERLRGELRRIAEGNLGDDPWQANYAKIKAIAVAALPSHSL